MLKNLKKSVQLRPFISVLYGTPGVGKTTFAAKAPDTLFFKIEDGLDGIESAKYPVTEDRDLFKSVHEVIKALNAVLTEDHDFTTLAIDSLSALEKLIWEAVSAEQSTPIAEIPYGRGYDMAMVYWHQIFELIELIRGKRNMIIILIGHCKIKKVLDPMSDDYERYMLDLQDKPSAYLTKWSDMILFADQEILTTQKDAGFNKKTTKAIGGHRVLYTVEDPKYMAKNRYGLPPKIALDWNKFWQTFMNSSSAKAAAAAGAEESTAVNEETKMQ
jgi:hypothetical protein